MTLQEIQDLIAGGESARMEFKKSTGQRTEAAKTVCAMLNGKGGQVLFSVAPDGAIVGQQLGSETLTDISHELRNIEQLHIP